MRLALAPGVGNTSLIRLLTAFGSPETVLASGRSALMQHLSAAQCDALLGEPDAALLEATLAWLDQPGNSLMTLADWWNARSTPAPGNRDSPSAQRLRSGSHETLHLCLRPDGARPAPGTNSFMA